MVDILIRNGEVIDGSGTRRQKADVAVDKGRIVDVGNLAGATATQVIDAKGCVVTPGFIDMHSHADSTLPICPTADSLVHQGITTVVVGNCGFTPAPLFPDTRDSVSHMLNGDAPEEQRLPLDKWGDFKSFLDYLAEIKTSVNVSALAGQGTIRVGIVGFVATPPTPAQMAKQQAAVDVAMDQGAIGISTGLIYPPGSYAKTEELIDFTRPVGKRHGYYFSHIRGEGDTLLDALAEAIRIGRETGAKVHISHYKAAGRNNWDKAARGLKLIDEANASGVKVSADMYPYLAGSTSLTAMLPEWAQEGGGPEQLKRLADPETRKKMTHSMKTEGFFSIAEWDKVLISGSRKKEYEGHWIQELADAVGKTPHEWIFDALLETNLGLGMIITMMDEENVKMQLTHPVMTIGTDGAGMPFEGKLASGLPHPRSFGTFPRVLGHYVREQKVLSLEEAIHKMSGLPAKHLGWTDRGLVLKGQRADLVVINPATVADTATYQKPFQRPLGIPWVIVNGRVEVADGAFNGVRAGQILR
jgi:N-acyl-D-amino-acid deacylase